MPPGSAAFRGMQLLALLGALALLVGDATAGLAGRLAGSLALAAAAVLRAVAQVAGFDGLNMSHCDYLQIIDMEYYIAFGPQSQYAKHVCLSFNLAGFHRKADVCG